MCEECKNKAISGELLSEDKLTEVVGGGPTENRWDPVRCGYLTKVNSTCRGEILTLLGMWCDHYRFTDVHNPVESYHHHQCVMGRYDYKTSRG